MTRKDYDKIIGDLEVLKRCCKYDGSCMCCDICYNSLPKAIEELSKLRNSVKLSEVQDE